MAMHHFAVKAAVREPSPPPGRLSYAERAIDFTEILKTRLSFDATRGDTRALPAAVLATFSGCRHL